MSVLFSIFVAQIIDPVRIILAFAATFWAVTSSQQGKRFTPISIAIIGVAALMSFLLSMMVPTTNGNMAAVSFVCGLFSTGVLVGVSALILLKLFRL